MANNNEENKGINPAAAGVVGVVIGAAAAGVAIVLSDKENRKKVGKAYKELKTEGTKRLTQLKKAADQVKSQATLRLEEADAVSAKVSKPKSKKA